jgi:hypothetical protein
VRVKVRSCTNPGNIGHVGEVALHPAARPRQGRPDVVPLEIWRCRRPTARRAADDARTIPAKLTDNVALMASDPSYYHRLMQLPEEERRMLADGDWDAWRGQMFGEFRGEHRVSEHDFELRAAHSGRPDHPVAQDSTRTGRRPMARASTGQSTTGTARRGPCTSTRCWPAAGVTFKEFYQIHRTDEEQAQQIRSWIESTDAQRKEDGKAPLNLDYLVMDQSMGQPPRAGAGQVHRGGVRGHSGPLHPAGAWLDRPARAYSASGRWRPHRMAGRGGRSAPRVPTCSARSPSCRAIPTTLTTSTRPRTTPTTSAGCSGSRGGAAEGQSAFAPV